MNFIIGKFRSYKFKQYKNEVNRQVNKKHININIHIEDFEQYKVFDKIKAKKWTDEKYKDADIDNETKKTIAKYCKENEPAVNSALRNGEINNQVAYEIKVLDKFLERYLLDENIVVFRLLNFNPFNDSKKFTEKGFMSTSLVNGYINSIHRHKYRLKIYLPRGAKGFYVNFISCRDGEYEILLPRNVTICYINDYIADDGKHEIECYVRTNK